jgi:hypothetical protein
MHHLVDRLPPTGVRRLRVLISSDPELAPFVGDEAAETVIRHLSFIGLGSSGRHDVSERHDELLRDGLDPLA